MPEKFVVHAEFTVDVQTEVVITGDLSLTETASLITTALHDALLAKAVRVNHCDIKGYRRVIA